MIIRVLSSREKQYFNQVVSHPLQTWEWGEFKKQTGMEVVRLGVFRESKLVQGWQIFFRKIPGTSFKVGYLPKTPLPEKNIVAALRRLGQQRQAIFLKLEPDFIVRRFSNYRGKIQTPAIFERETPQLENMGLRPAIKPIFARFSFEIDLTKSETELLANMHPKTRYNIRLASRKGVVVRVSQKDADLVIFLDLLEETLKRQGFFLHDRRYFRALWEILKPTGMVYLLLASWQNKPLVAWMLFVWQKKLFYPYGASASWGRNLMASNLVCWEAIRFGKQLGCQKFDLWGSLGPNAKNTDPWFGFHRFKLGYGGDLVEFIGSWDLALSPIGYYAFHCVDKLRWYLLRLKRFWAFQKILAKRISAAGGIRTRTPKLGTGS